MTFPGACGRVRSTGVCPARRGRPPVPEIRDDLKSLNRMGILGKGSARLETLIEQSMPIQFARAFVQEKEFAVGAAGGRGIIRRAGLRSDQSAGGDDDDEQNANRE